MIISSIIFHMQNFENILYFTIQIFIRLFLILLFLVHVLIQKNQIYDLLSIHQKHPSILYVYLLIIDLILPILVVNPKYDLLYVLILMCIILLLIYSLHYDLIMMQLIVLFLILLYIHYLSHLTILYL